MTARLYSFAAVAALAGLAFLWLTMQLPGGEDVSTLIGPRTWPEAILVTMLVLVALMVALLAWRGPAQFTGVDEGARPDSEFDDEAVTREDSSDYGWRHLGVLVATIAYTVIMEFTGYLAATAVFAAIVTVILGERRPLRVLITTGTAVALVAAVFDRLLNIPLP